MTKLRVRFCPVILFNFQQKNETTNASPDRTRMNERLDGLPSSESLLSGIQAQDHVLQSLFATVIVLVLK